MSEDDITAGDANSIDLRRLLGLMVHDLRNPAATIRANVTYVREVGAAPETIEDVQEALADVDQALSDMLRGLDHLSWLGRMLVGESVVRVADGDVAALAASYVEKETSRDIALDIETTPLVARGGAIVGQLLPMMLANSMQHARRGTIHVRAGRDGGDVVVEVEDSGAALAIELRSKAFTLAGQVELKGRADGRYGRNAGLFASRLLAEAAGGTIEAAGEPGAAIFRLRLRAAVP